METPPDGFFVARDRARRVGWAIERVLQERRLGWRGDEVGMASVADDADRTIAALAEDARESVAAVLEGRVRDRERGFMEIPFVVALTTVAGWLEEAAHAEADRRLGRGTRDATRERAERALTEAAARLEAFQAGYDAKSPVLEARTVDVSRLLERADPGSDRLWDRPPPPLRSEGHALLDLLVATRRALPEAEGPWRVVLPGPGRPLELQLGEPGPAGEDVAVPPDVARAADVLGFRHPVAVQGVATPGGPSGGRLAGLRLTLGAPPGTGMEATLEMLAGPDARLTPEADRAVRTLFAAPPLPTGPAAGGVPPERLVALVGVERLVEQQVREVLAPRLKPAAVRMAAGGLPRERTRKAPVRRTLLEALRADVPGLPVEALGDLAKSTAKGSVRERDLSLEAGALLLLVFGRDAAVGGVRLERVLDLAPLSGADVEALGRDLVDVVTGRRALAAGDALDAAALTSFESAAVAALGRLGRLA